MTDQEVYSSVSRDCLAWVGRLARAANMPNLHYVREPASALPSPLRWIVRLFRRPEPPSVPFLTGGQVAELVATLNSAGNLLGHLAKQPSGQPKEPDTCQKKY